MAVKKQDNNSKALLGTLQNYTTAVPLPHIKHQVCGKHYLTMHNFSWVEPSTCKTIQSITSWHPL